MANWYAETFSDLLIAIDSAIREFINDHEHQAPIFWHQVYEHFDYTYPDATLNPNPAAAGKRVRPVLMALVAKSLSNGDYAHVLPSAVALEIIHNFTLIHDDIMDESDTRRGRTTIWKNYGLAQAIDSGDGLFALGILSSLSLDTVGISAEKALTASKLLLRACLDTVEGQALDINFEERLDISPAEYLQMISLKTGKFIQVAAHIGALLSTDDQQTIDAFTVFGENIGIAFQIWDDYLGIWGDPEIIGKSATGDIEQKKKSYPITYILAHGSDEQKDRLRAIYEQESISPFDVAEVREMLTVVDAQSQTNDIVSDYYDRAMAALDSLNLSEADYNNIRGLADFIIKRDH